MFVGTHAFLPVLVASAVNAYRVRSGRRSLFTVKELVLIGVAGSLPDLLSPHISLSARLSSWTHNLWFLLGSCPILLMSAWFLSRQKHLLLGIFLWAAVALHLIVDMSSGGISPFYPFEAVIGFRTVPFHYWFHLDVFLISAFLLLAFWVRRAERTDQLE